MGTSPTGAAAPNSSMERIRTGRWIAVAGAVAGVIGSVLLTTRGYDVPSTPPGTCYGNAYCPAPPDVLFVPWIPLWFAVLMILAALLPLLVLVRPRFWSWGVLSVLATEGALGGLGVEITLLPPAYALLPSSPTWLFLLWAVGAVTSSIGFWWLRPRASPTPRPLGPDPSPG